jgi:hypothetical protein
VELRLRTLAVAGDVAEIHGSRDVAGWLAKTVRADPAKVRAEERLASAVADRFTATAAALAKGGLNLEQVRVITACVDDLPDRVGVAVKQQAEADLIRLAADFGPAELRRLGRAILHVTEGHHGHLCGRGAAVGVHRGRHPAVLGGESEVLDLGRKQRLFSTAIRRALRLRDPVCRGEGCTIPARWCEAHHLQSRRRTGRGRLGYSGRFSRFALPARKPPSTP